MRYSYNESKILLGSLLHEVRRLAIAPEAYGWRPSGLCLCRGIDPQLRSPLLQTTRQACQLVFSKSKHIILSYHYSIHFLCKYVSIQIQYIYLHLPAVHFFGTWSCVLKFQDPNLQTAPNFKLCPQLLLYQPQ